MTSVAEEVLGLQAMLSADEARWAQRARQVAHSAIVPSIDADFENHHFRKEVVSELAAAGLLGMHIEGHGCSGASPVAYALACYEIEAIDSAWRTFISVQGSLAMSAIAKFGSPEQKEHLLPSMAKGEVIGCFALTEPEGGSDPAAMTTYAYRAGTDWVITGRKRWIGLASLANVAVVWARTDDGVRGFVVPTTAPGFSAEDIQGKLSLRASVQCDIRFDEVRVPEDALLPLATGLSAPLRCLNEARFGIAWGVMGAARTCLDAAIERARTREVFGKKIGAMQLVQSKLADAFVEYEKGMLLALHLGRLKDAEQLDTVQVSIAKLNNVRQAIAIASASRSILAGDGITNDYPVMRHMGNLESVRTYEGTDEVHTLILGRALTGEDAFR